MSEKISLDETNDIARLSRINITPAEGERMSEKFSNILDAFASIQSIEIQSERDGSILRNRSNLRDDEVKSSLGQEMALKTAPLSFKGHFRVPSVL